METLHHPAANPHMPFFITPPNETDVLLWVMAVVLVGAVLGVGVLFFWLHSLPERLVHNKVQFDIVALLALLSLFTHIHAFWIAALIIAFIDFPEFSLPHFSENMKRMADSLDRLAERDGENRPDPATAPDKTEQTPKVER